MLRVGHIAIPVDIHNLVAECRKAFYGDQIRLEVFKIHLPSCAYKVGSESLFSLLEVVQAIVSAAS